MGCDLVARGGRKGAFYYLVEELEGSRDTGIKVRRFLLEELGPYIGVSFESPCELIRAPEKPVR